MANRGAAAIAAATVLLAGCGGSGGGGGGKAVPDPEAVTAAVSGFSRAFGAGDGAKSCALLTPAARTAFLKRVRTLVDATDCATAIKGLHDQAGSQVMSAFSTAKVGAVHVIGTTATAGLTASGHSTTVHLAKLGGAWKLTALPGT